MKMHTFFLSGKAIAIVSGAVGACGLLLFVSGILVGVRIQPDGRSRVTARNIAAVPTVSVHESSLSSSADVAARGSTRAENAPQSTMPTPATAAWPFTASGYAPQTAPTDGGAAQGTGTLDVPTNTQAPVIPSPSPAPVAPITRAPARRGMTGQISMIAYAAPRTDAEADDSIVGASSVANISQANVRTQRDDAEYLVQVGMFRVEGHARDLAARLTNAGYRATITVRHEGDRDLHVVRVGRFTGLLAAEQAAARIGGTEELVASVVAARD